MEALPPGASWEALRPSRGLIAGEMDDVGREYWLVSLPIYGGTREATWDTLQQLTVYAQDLSTNFKLAVPDTLRVGTLDSLLELSDDLNRMTASVEGTAAKLRRQCADAAEHSSGSGGGGGTFFDDGDDAGSLRLADSAAVESFRWDEAKFPSGRPLKESVERIVSGVHKVDDALKMKLSEANAARASLAAVSRKAQGSLAVREVGSLIQPSQVVQSENLCTLLVVVAKHLKRDFFGKRGYETWARFSFVPSDSGESCHISAAVPRSALTIAEDKDYELVRVVVFRQMADAFKGASREKGFQVRDFTFDAEDAKTTAANLEAMRREATELNAQLLDWSATAYRGVLSSWLHLLCIRVFVESILRYGLPPSFQAAVVKPNRRCEEKVRAALASQFGSLVSGHWKVGESAGAEEMRAAAAMDADMYPYVSFTVDFSK